MVVRIRLQRFGVRNHPFYRIVVADSRCPRDGRFIERVGTYNPIANKDNIKEITANTERIHYWLSCGAQPSERVGWIFGKLGLLPTAPVRQSVESAVPKVLRKVTKA
eukprot:gene4664-5110_t